MGNQVPPPVQVGLCISVCNPRILAGAVTAFLYGYIINILTSLLLPDAPLVKAAMPRRVESAWNAVNANHLFLT